MDGDLRDRDDAPPSAAALGLEPGAVLNGIYRIDRFVTRGGMGDVYAGSNVETDERVAIKVMLPRLAADPKILSLFRNEARLLTRVAHPAVAQYRVFARDATFGVHYLVTDFIDGDALSTRLRGGAPAADEVARLIRRLAGGLRVTHELGAVHRDMSPDNILLPGGRIDEAKIIDFGIAKYIEPDDRTVVIEGFAGKLGYVAPEQFGLFGNRIGPWTDIYSTALVLLAFARSEPIDMGRTMAEAMERRAGVPDLAGLPDGLHPLFRAMLQPDPADRPASMEAVVDALEQPSARIARPGPLRRATDTPAKAARARGRWIATIAATICLAALLLWAAWPRTGARPPRLAQAHRSPPVPKTTAPTTAVPVVPPVSIPTAAPVASVPTTAAMAPAAPAVPVAPGPTTVPPSIVGAATMPRWRRAAWPCRSTGGSPAMVTIDGLTDARSAALLFLTPNGRPLTVFASQSPQRTLATTRSRMVRAVGRGRYRFLLCADGAGEAAFVLIDGTGAVPMLSAASAGAGAMRYRDVAARRGWGMTTARVPLSPSGRPLRPSAEAPIVAALPTPVAPAPRAEPSPASRSTPASAFCRHFKGGRWRDIGQQTRDGCLAAAFKHGGAGYVQFGDAVLRRYAGHVDVQANGEWERVDGGGAKSR